MAEMSEVIGAGIGMHYLSMFIIGKTGPGWYHVGRFWPRGDEWVFSTQKGEFPEIAAQLIKYLPKNNTLRS